ncbi:MAG: hypothetical protein H6R15_61 [Proteobacteria bacterium]|nr:hypothetical protein [Pseudomonadota bacterium]
MTDLSAIRLEDFLPRLQQDFDLSIAAMTLQLRLIEATPYSRYAHAQAARTPFSLIFRGPSHPALMQDTYHLSSSDGLSAPIFLVPIKHDESGMYYQAVFN